MIAYCRKGQRNKIEHVISYLTLIFTYICMYVYFINNIPFLINGVDPKALNGSRHLALNEYSLSHYAPLKPILPLL